jgi:hypothetical protein
MSSTVPIPLRVECYSGYRAEERPEAFWLRDRRVAVQVILDRWYGEDHAYFKVVGDDGIRYIMRRDDARGIWELILMEVPAVPATEARA